jgi:hypothetical protein
MKAIFEFDRDLGMITGKNGTVVHMMGIEPFDEPDEAPSRSTIDDLVKLKAAGFTAEEIVLLNNSGI